jgi:ATP-binding cassette subfamily B protein
MKALKHLNKYFFQYKWYLILGTLFTFISNLFGVVPAQIVRYALDLVKETISLYFHDGFGAQTVVYEIFAFSILLYGSLILIMALLKGIFLFL